MTCLPFRCVRVCCLCPHYVCLLQASCYIVVLIHPVVRIFQVLIGPDENNDGLGPWYFSLNNRRLWVLKQCHKEGLLDNERYNNKIAVRVRMPKSGAEAERYSVDNCALEAKFMREGNGGGGGGKKKKGKNGKGKNKMGVQVQSEADGDSDGPSKEASNDITNNKCAGGGEDDNGNDKHETINEDESDSESDSDDDIAHDNPFSALF